MPGKKKLESNVRFFLQMLENDIILSSYFQQCVLNQSISYLVNLDIDLMHNRTEKVKKNAAYNSMSLKLL